MDKVDLLIARMEAKRTGRLRVTFADGTETVTRMEPDPDGLSLSLWALEAELAALDEAGIAAEAETLGITLDDVREMVRTYAR